MCHYSAMHRAQMCEQEHGASSGVALGWGRGGGTAQRRPKEAIRWARQQRLPPDGGWRIRGGGPQPALETASVLLQDWRMVYSCSAAGEGNCLCLVLVNALILFLQLLHIDKRREYLYQLQEFLVTDNSRNWRFRAELAE